MQGYWGPHAFIAAQTPLPDTMADFWSMVYQKRASAVVMLSDCEEGDEVQAQCPSLVCCQACPSFTTNTLLLY